jgi:hypothetical protein
MFFQPPLNATEGRFFVIIEHAQRRQEMVRKRILVTTIALIVVFTLAAPAFADGPSAVAWLRTQQNADGGFGSPASSVGATADTVLAAAASGENAFTWSKEGKTPLGFIKANIGSASKAGDVAKVILALTANGMSPRTALETDLIKKLEAMIGSEGKIGGQADFINEHCMAMIALKSAFRPTNPQTISYLASRQIKDGTWSWNGDTTEGSGDNNTTALAVVALVAAGVPKDNGQIQQAMVHLKKQQNADGGFPYINPSPYGTDSDSNSTAVVMWAIIAAGQDPAGTDWKVFTQDGTSVYDRIVSFQNASGAFRWQDAMPDDNFLSSVQALIALEQKTLPFARFDADQPVKPTPTPAPATETTTGTTESTIGGEEPAFLPVSGANLWLYAATLLASGATLAGLGLKLRKRTS